MNGYAAAGHDRLLRLVTQVALGCAGTLVVVKAVAWQMSGATTLLASLLDSVLDTGASLMILLSVRRALRPPDEHYRFGHGKAEALAALAEAAFIVASAVFLLLQAGYALSHPRLPQHTGVGIAVMVFSLAVTLGLVAFQHYVVRRTGSLAISADSLHYTGDVLMNLSVILALALSAWLHLPQIDPLCTLGIALYIGYNARGIARDALAMLLDRELPETERRRITKVVFAQPQVLGMHELRTRAAGPTIFIQCHVELDANLSLSAAHAVADTVEEELRRAFPGAEVIIHQDPFQEVGADVAGRILRPATG